MAGNNIIVGDIVRHESFGIGKVEEAAGTISRVYFSRSEKDQNVPNDELQVISDQDVIAYDMVKMAVYENRMEEFPSVAIGTRWIGGEMVLKPADGSQASKSIPVETLFHKIVMIRDRLRVMEAQINAHKNLQESEKIELQQYITRIYGSLTTFNILFKDKKDFFIGQKVG